MDPKAFSRQEPILLNKEKFPQLEAGRANSGQRMSFQSLVRLKEKFYSWKLGAPILGKESMHCQKSLLPILLNKEKFHSPLFLREDSKHENQTVQVLCCLVILFGKAHKKYFRHLFIFIRFFHLLFRSPLFLREKYTRHLFIFTYSFFFPSFVIQEPAYQTLVHFN